MVPVTRSTACGHPESAVTTTASAAVMGTEPAADVERQGVLGLPDFTPAPPQDAPVAGWRAGLPELRGLRVSLRELRHDDARALLSHVTTEEVARFISSPPASVEEFDRFIIWARERRAQGQSACFAVVSAGQDAPVGLFQVRLLDPSGEVAECGVALGAAYWSRGLFLEGALMLMQFAFETIGVRRLEAQACLANGRGVGALRKVGAVRERVLRGTFVRGGRRLDQGLWVLRRERWQTLVTPRTSLAH